VASWRKASNTEIEENLVRNTLIMETVQTLYSLDAFKQNELPSNLLQCNQKPAIHDLDQRKSMIL
jgi:hypothetical protein